MKIQKDWGVFAEQGISQSAEENCQGGKTIKPDMNMNGGILRFLTSVQTLLFLRDLQVQALAPYAPGRGLRFD